MQVSGNLEVGFAVVHDQRAMSVPIVVASSFPLAGVGVPWLPLWLTKVLP